MKGIRKNWEALLSLGCLFLVGCSWDEQALIEEREQLELARDNTLSYASQFRPGSQWSDHPDTDRILNKVGETNGRMYEIDRQLQSR